jgi:hypothetical protein
MTPFEIEILLHYSCTSLPFRHEDTPAFRSAISKLIDADVIVQNADKSYRGVPAALEVYINALGAVPLPEKKWVI